MSIFPQVRFILSVASAQQFPPDAGLEVAIAGRSNSGKSSAINALLARRALARTSKTPGRTQLLNYFELAPGYRLVDLPGYGYAAVAPDKREVWIQLLDELPRRASFGALLLIVDARRGVQQQDMDVIAWSGLPAAQIHLLLSKSDQLKNAEARTALLMAGAVAKSKASVQLFSARSNTGVEEARAVLMRWQRTIKNPGGEPPGSD